MSEAIEKTEETSVAEKVVAKAEKKDDILFFSEVDMIKGKVASEYPAWYFTSIIETLEDDIRRDEYAVKHGLVPEGALPKTRERITKLREKLDNIEASYPKLSDRQRDELSLARKELGEKIADSMFTRSQMQKGLADSHEEARRMSRPIIGVDSRTAALARSCNVQVTDGKISRQGAEKMWKIASRYLGEMSNAESLRRD